MRLTIVLPGLSNSGGIERVATLHANHFAEGGHEMRVVVFDDPGEPFFPLLPRIVVTNIRSRQANPVMRRLDELRRLRVALRSSRPDVVISIFRNNLVLLATWLTGIPVVITEHMDPGRAWMAPGRRQLQRLLYGRAARLVSVSRGVDRQFDWLDQSRRLVIYNPIAPSAPAPAAAPLPPGRRYLLAVGRFVEQKGFDLLLRAFALIAPRHADWDLCIVGGAPPPQYRELIDASGLQGRVHFPGVVRDIRPYYEQADLYVLSSRHEAFPLVLIEAMGHGLPAVAYACPSGPDEVIEHGRNGLLVPPEDVSALARSIEQAIDDDPWRLAAREHALATAERFSLGAIMPAWEALLASVTSGS